MSEYVEEGTKIYKDEDGIFRPLDGDPNELVGTQMSDSFFSPTEEAPVAEETPVEETAAQEQPQDIVYVEPLKKKFYSVRSLSSAVSVSISAITLYLLLINN